MFTIWISVCLFLGESVCKLEKRICMQVCLYFILNNVFQYNKKTQNEKHTQVGIYSNIITFSFSACLYFFGLTISLTKKKEVCQ